MCRQLVLSCLVLTAAVPAVVWAGNPQVNAIRTEIRLLREQEKVTIALIRGYYRTIIAFEKLDERGRALLRRNLAAGERQALALARTAKQKQQIRAYFTPFLRVLSGQMRLDAGVIRTFRAAETVHTRFVQSLYRVAIVELEQVVRVASQVRPVGTPHRR